MCVQAPANHSSQQIRLHLGKVYGLARLYFADVDVDVDVCCFIAVLLFFLSPHFHVVALFHLAPRSPTHSRCLVTIANHDTEW